MFETIKRNNSVMAALKVLLLTVMGFVSYLVFIGLGGPLIGTPIAMALLSPLQDSAPELYATAGPYLLFVGMAIATLVPILVIRPLRPMLGAFGPKARGNNVRRLLMGLGAGLGANCLCALAAALNQDIALSFERFEPLPFLLLFVCVFIQSSTEELICRGFLQQLTARLFTCRWIIMLFNPLVFSLFHLFNPGVTPLALAEVFVVGVLFAAMAYYCDSLWMACGYHAAWNFAQAILLGLPNSGTVSPYHVMALDAASARDSFFYNVGFGVEGTWFSVIITVALLVVLVAWGERTHRRPTNVWELAKAEKKAEETGSEPAEAPVA